MRRLPPSPCNRRTLTPPIRPVGLAATAKQLKVAGGVAEKLKSAMIESLAQAGPEQRQKLLQQVCGRSVRLFPTPRERLSVCGF